jgi:hypothetical protein
MPKVLTYEELEGILLLGSAEKKDKVLKVSRKQAEIIASFHGMAETLIETIREKTEGENRC